MIMENTPFLSAVYYQNIFELLNSSPEKRHRLLVSILGLLSKAEYDREHLMKEQL